MCSNVVKDWAKKNTDFREIWLSLNLWEEKMKSAAAGKTDSNLHHDTE